jgi:hypothetical protein
MRKFAGRLLAGLIPVVSISLLVTGCGGGGSGDGGSGANIHRFEIYGPVRSGSTYRTTNPSVGVWGEGFAAPQITNCEGMQKLRISWRNSANDSSGTGTSFASCLCIIICGPSSHWEIRYGQIPLEMGSNSITVTGSAAGGSRSASITVIREAAAAALASRDAQQRQAAYPEPTEGLEVTRLPEPGGDSNVLNLHYPLAAVAMQDPGQFDRMRVMSDLVHHIRADSYDFVLFYSLTGWPGWEEPRGPCVPPAQNIGFDNRRPGFDSCGNIPADWAGLRTYLVLPLMPDRPGAEDRNLQRALRGMGRAWGVHGTLRDDLPGLMASTADGNRFNAFDLYTMGLMDYHEVYGYEYPSRQRDDGARAPDLTVEDYIGELRFRGENYCGEDGRRVPGVDQRAMNLRALLVLLTAGNEKPGEVELAELLRLSETLPETWHNATWGRSVLSTEVVER